MVSTRNSWSSLSSNLIDSFLRSQRDVTVIGITTGGAVTCVVTAGPEVLAPAFTMAIMTAHLQERVSHVRITGLGTGTFLCHAELGG